MPKNVQPLTTDPPKTPCPTSQLMKCGLGPQHQTTPHVQPPHCPTHFLCAPAPAFEVLSKTKGRLGRLSVRRPPPLAGMTTSLTPPSGVSHQGVAHDKPTVVGPLKSDSQPFPVIGAHRTSQLHQPTVVTHPRQPILNEFTHSYTRRSSESGSRMPTSPNPLSPTSSIQQIPTIGT